MSKTFVACAALVGVALLGSRADAINLLIKSRAIPPGGNGSVPVQLTGTPASGQIWGVDFALAFDNPALTAQDPNNAFVQFSGNAAASDVVVTGNTFVGGGTQPNLYVGVLKGTTGLDLTKGVGLLKVKVATGTARTTVINMTVPPTYNVKNTGDGTDQPRAGATAVTSTATPNDPVNSEPVTVLDSTGAGAFNVPLHRIAATIPGDATADGFVNNSDVILVSRMLNSLTATSPTRLITADVSGLNGYTSGNVPGTAGLSYGDNLVNNSDLVAITRKAAGVAGLVFPVPE